MTDTEDDVHRARKALTDGVAATYGVPMSLMEPPSEEPGAIAQRNLAYQRLDGDEYGDMLLFDRALLDMTPDEIRAALAANPDRAVVAKNVRLD